MRSRNLVRFASIVLIVAPLRTALAQVGAITAMDGEATRARAGGNPLALQVGSKIELGDVIEVKSGSVKLTLTDQSILILSSGSQIRIDEASFQQLDHRQFSAWLLLGAVWCNVTRALGGSDAKFEVATERAVAGVRGTVFQVDVSGSAKEAESLVQVDEGKVAVSQRGSGPSERGNAQEISAGEAMRVRRAGMTREPAFVRRHEAFERFIQAHGEREHRGEMRRLEQRPRKNHEGLRHR
jgi:hypothetical protein